MFEPQEKLRLLQEQCRKRDTVQQFVIENRNAATLVDVRYKSTWVTSDILHLIRSDAVTVRTIQPTEQINLKLQVSCNERIGDILDDD